MLLLLRSLLLLLALASLACASMPRRELVERVRVEALAAIEQAENAGLENLNPWQSIEDDEGNINFEEIVRRVDEQPHLAFVGADGADDADVEPADHEVQLDEHDDDDDAAAAHDDQAVSEFAMLDHVDDNADRYFANDVEFQQTLNAVRTDCQRAYKFLTAHHLSCCPHLKKMKDPRYDDKAHHKFLLWCKPLIEHKYKGGEQDGQEDF